MALVHYTQTIRGINETISNMLPLAWFQETAGAKFLHAAYVLLFVYPLQQVYLRGFWHGLPLQDICAALTSHRSEFWASHMTECLVVASNHFDGWLVYSQFALYLAACYVIVFRWWCRTPV